MNKLLLRLVILLCCLMPCLLNAQVVNRALEFDGSGEVDCGLLQELDNREEFIVQLWIKPSEWTTGATLISRGAGFSISLGKPGEINFSVGGTTITTNEVPTDEWSLVTLRNSNGKTYINGKRKSEALPSMPASKEGDKLTIGKDYIGILDEIRIWGSCCGEEFDYFEHTTLNQLNPYWNELLVYFKMDQELTGHIVDYKGVYDRQAEYNHHGILYGGVKRVEANNEKLPYLTNSAYTENSRFYDRAIEREQYLLSNDLIILGIESLPSGHLRMTTPNNHATLSGDAVWMKEYEGREGVVSFNGDGRLESSTECLRSDAASYTIESWVYVDRWVEGAYLFRKETEDGLNGISVRLGREGNHEVIVRVNGKNFVNQRKMASGRWIHVGISVEGGDKPFTTFAWIYDGKNIGQGSNDCDDSIDYIPVGNDTCQAYIGEGLVGKIDNFAVWDVTRGRTGFDTRMKQEPLPGLGIVQTADMMQATNTLYTFDDEEWPGYDSWSQENWKRIMESAYEGYRGWRTRISVRGHDNWQGTLSNPIKRKRFAEDVARLSEGYAGVELDLEWIYGTQTLLGLLSDDIKAFLPEGKSLMISCHNVAYKFPHDKMDNCEGFTFQQYGPQGDNFRYSHFEKMTKAFSDYGFPAEKILCSYSTTTSEGHINGNRPQNAPHIKGVRDGFLEGDYVPSEEVDSEERDGFTFYFDGPLQTYRRARYVTDNRLGGIFYWDMGNDVKPTHRYNLAKWCSMGLNANVDTIVEKVEVKHPDLTSLGVNSVKINESRFKADSTGQRGIFVLSHGKGVPVNSVVKVYDMKGVLCQSGKVVDGRLDLSHMPNGVYMVKAEKAGNRPSSSIKLILN